MYSKIRIILLSIMLSGCAMTYHYQYGRSLESAKVKSIHEGMPKSHVIALLGNPYETIFIDPSPVERQQGIVVREVMTYYSMESSKKSYPPILRNLKDEQDGVMQQFDVLLENGFVVKHEFTSEEL